ncbi:hypothetical protein H0H92_001875 [Tricholoma furcatifolium]|nr:hypothetical protein H0H92_001875 [Tricholoma furcatifolium]
MDPHDADNAIERDEQPAVSTSQLPAPSQAQFHPGQRRSPTSMVPPPLSIPRSVYVRSAEMLIPSEENTHSPYYTRESASGRYGNPLPPLPTGSIAGDRPPGRTRTFDTLQPSTAPSRLDWIVPIEEKKVIGRLTVGERLQPTLTRAHLERDKYAAKAKRTGYTLNAAIGMQVLLGSLTTGISAAALTGKQAAVATTILGGLSTCIASYLARARGSKEPELSITRVKDLEQFIREVDAFQMDYGHIMTDEQDHQVFKFRSRFEELLGNASGERKLAPPV